MRTTVLGLRLNDYQREKLKVMAEKNGMIEADLVREQINKLIDGRIESDTNIRAFAKIAKEKGLSAQGLLDLIAEQLNEPSRDKE